MIKEDELIYIGYLSRTHGKQGSLQCHVSNDFIGESDPEFVVLKLDNIFVPFRLSDWREKNAEVYILTLRDVVTEEQASRLVGNELYLLRSCITDHPEEAITLQDLVGMEVIDLKHGPIGTIAEVDESTINTLFLLSNGRIIPAHDDFVEDINYNTRQLFVSLPDGLIGD